MDEVRLLEYLKGRSYDELSSIVEDIKKNITVEENLSATDKDRFLTTLSYVETLRNGLAQKVNIEQEPETRLIDTSQFSSMTSKELIEVLGLSIKKDEVNKLITFLAHLSAYTDDSQLNISFNAPSAFGKSYIPMEIAKLFPREEVIQLGYSSPTAFFHNHGTFDKEKKGYIVDLSRKILIFLDQPHNLLLQHLRPMLSHDKKEIKVQITDKSQKFGLKTKNIYLIGYPTVIFCTAGLKLDEQEATRFLLLSPEISKEKIREAILEKIKRESNKSDYNLYLEGDPRRKKLRDRIIAIKQESITEIRVNSPELVEKMFFERAKTLKPRHTRDMGRIMSLIKVLALLNVWFRERDGSSLIANEEDIKAAFELYDSISESQELNLPPYVFNLYKDVILAVYKEKNIEKVVLDPQGVTRQELLQKHYEVYGRFLPDWQLRQQIIPPLETAGLIIQEQDPTNKRKILIFPTTTLTKSENKENSESNGGIDTVTDTED